MPNTWNQLLLDLQANLKDSGENIEDYELNRNSMTKSNHERADRKKGKTNNGKSAELIKKMDEMENKILVKITEAIKTLDNVSAGNSNQANHDHVDIPASFRTLLNAYGKCKDANENNLKTVYAELITQYNNMYNIVINSKQRDVCDYSDFKNLKKNLEELGGEMEQITEKNLNNDWLEDRLRMVDIELKMEEIFNFCKLMSKKCDCCAVLKEKGDIQPIKNPLERVGTLKNSEGKVGRCVLRTFTSKYGKT